MLTIYHNTRCAKSRDGVAYLEKKGVDFQIRNYLNDPFTAAELKTLLTKAGLKPIEVLRTEETYYKEKLKGKHLTDDELIEEMIAEPRLIQRPIVENNEKAVLARPVENIELLF